VLLYATPSSAAKISIGEPCSVHCRDDGRRRAATVQSIGSVWIVPPDDLGFDADRARVAVTLTVDDEESPFSANARVKAAFETDRWTAVKVRVSDWFQR